MKVLRPFIICLFTIIALNCRSQSPIEKAFPDSVKPYKPKILTVFNLDSLKPFMLDTLHNPDGYIFVSHTNNQANGPFIALKKKSYYNYFYATGENGGNGIDKGKMIDFGGKGCKKFLLNYHENMGNEYFSEYHQGFYLWDLDKIELLMSVEYIYSNSDHGISRDSTGEYIQTDSGSEDCYNFKPSFTNNTITFTETNPPCQWEQNEAEKREQKANPLINPRVIKYKLHKGNLIRVNSIPK